MRNSTRDALTPWFAALAVGIVIAAYLRALEVYGQDAPAQALEEVWVAYADPRAYVKPYKETVLAMGLEAKLYIAAVYLVSTVFMLPLWGFHIAVGYIYGITESVLLITTTQAFAAGAAFSASRYVVRPWVREYMEERFGANYNAIDAAVSKRGLYVTVLIRLSPLIPFGVNNYLCGCTEMELWKFVVGTWFGVVSGNYVYCRIGALGDDGETSNQVKAIGVMAALLLVYVVSKLAAGALKDAGIGGDGAPSTTPKKKRAKSPRRKCSAKKNATPKTPKSEKKNSSAKKSTRAKPAEGLDLVWVNCSDCKKWRYTMADDPDVKGEWSCNAEFWSVKQDEWRRGCRWLEDSYGDGE